MESKEVSKLPSEEVEVLEQPSEGVSGEGSEWKECMVVVLEPVKTLVLRYNTSVVNCDLLVCSEVRTWCAYQTLL